MTPEAAYRQFVSDMYSGRRWKQKVARMSDAQIYAIWVKEQEKKDPPPKPNDESENIPF